MAQLGSATVDWGLLITGIPLCLIARAANIFPLAQLANWRKHLAPFVYLLNIQTCKRYYIDLWMNIAKPRKTIDYVLCPSQSSLQSLMIETKILTSSAAHNSASFYSLCTEIFLICDGFLIGDLEI